jgi:hypothetical protein
MNAMKIWTTALVVAAIGIFAVKAGASDGEKPNIAVYVVSEELSESEMRGVESKILSRFVRSGRYVPVDRSAVSLSELTKEMKKQRSGSVDENKISSLGKQAGAELLFVAELARVGSGYEHSARLLDTETAEIVEMGSVKISTLDNMEWAVNDVFEQVVNRKRAGRAPQKRVSQRGVFSQNVKFGGRGGANMFSYSDKYPYNSYYKKGSGLEAGPALRIRVSDYVSIYAEAAYQYRTLYSFSYYSYANNYTNKENITESLVSVPVTVQFAPIYSVPFYAEAGVKLEIPLKTERSINYIDNRVFSRNSTNWGVVLGLGYMVTPNFAIDMRGVAGLTPLFATFNESKYGSLVQFGAGAAFLI